MRGEDAYKEDYEHIELFDVPGLFTNSRIDRETVPAGWYCYDLRGSDDDPGDPTTAEEQVTVNHAGTVLLPKALKLNRTDINGTHYRNIGEGLNFLDGEITLEEFCKEHGLTFPERTPNLLSGSRRLRPDDHIIVSDDMLEMDGHLLNFYLETWFNVDEVFGTHVCTEENDDYLNVYADYNMKRGVMCDSLSITLWHGDECEEYAYSLSDEEKAMLLPKMEEHCVKLTGVGLAEYSAKRLAEEQETERPPKLRKKVTKHRGECR